MHFRIPGFQRNKPGLPLSILSRPTDSPSSTQAAQARLPQQSDPKGKGPALPTGSDSPAHLAHSSAPQATGEVFVVGTGKSWRPFGPPAEPLKPDTMSSHPPAHQAQRHAHDLMRQELNTQLSHPSNSKEYRMYGKNVDLLKGYEAHVAYSKKYQLDREKRALHADRRAVADHNRPIQAESKALRAEIRKGDARLQVLEREHAALKARLDVLGAQSKGDAYPVKFTTVMNKKTHFLDEQRARFVGKPSLAERFRSVFRGPDRSPRDSKPEVAEKLSAKAREIEDQKASLMRMGDRYVDLTGRLQVPAQYPIEVLPTRESILGKMYASQPLRKGEWQDVPDPRRAVLTDAPNLRSALRQPDAGASGKRVGFVPGGMGT